MPIVVLATIEALQATMPHSVLERAKRGFVQVLLSVAATFSVPVKVNRDSGSRTTHMLRIRIVA